MKRSTTKNALLMSALSLFLCFAMLTGTTFAWFTDTVESGVNQIVAGNLDIELYHSDKAASKEAVTTGTKLFNDVDSEKWEPGAMAWEKFDVENKGNLALQYQLTLNAINPTVVDSVSFASMLKVAIVDETFTYTRENVAALPTESWSDLATFTLTGELEEGESAVHGIIIWWQPSDIDNLFNMNNTNSGKKVSVDVGVKLFATQLQAEQDSFGKDYDKDSMTSVYDAQGLQAALNAGEKNITLEDDITLDQPLVISASVTTYSLRSAAQPTVIDLNGKTITGNKGRDADNNRIHVIVNNGILTIKNGTVKSAGNDGGSAIYNNAGATLTIENVTVYGAPQSDPVYEAGVSKPFPSYAVNNYGNAVVNGATIKSYHGAIATGGNGVTVINDADIDVGLGQSTGITSYAIYSYEDAQVTVNGGKFAFTKQEVYVNGGNIFCELGTNPIMINGGNYICTSFSTGAGREYVIKGGTFDKDPTKWLADGCEAKANADGTYTVTMSKDTIKENLSNAQSGETVVIPEGTYTFPASDLKEGVTLQCTPGTVFEGKSGLDINGATVIGATFDAGTGNTAAAGTINGTFKDCVFTGSEALRWCYSEEGDTAVFENCVFKTDFRGVHFDTMDGDVTFINCEINGFNAFGGAGTVTFVGCTFGYDESYYNGLNMYCNTVLKNCEFKYLSNKSNFVDFEAAGKSLTIENCTATLDGKEASILDFVGGTYKSQTTIIVDGAQLVSSNDALKAAIEAKASKILLANGDYSVRFTNNTSFNVDDMTIVGMGDNVNLSVSSSEAWYGRVQGDNVTFENIKFNGTTGATGKATYNNCTISRLECASSGSAETCVNDCEIGTFHTSTDFNSGAAYVKNSTITKAEYSGGTVMNFKNCTIGELISWNTTTVLTGCQVTNIDKTGMTTNTITVDGVVVAPLI